MYERDRPLDELGNATELHEKMSLTTKQVTPEVEDAALVEADEVPDEVVNWLTQTTSSPSCWNVPAHEVQPWCRFCKRGSWMEMMPGRDQNLNNRRLAIAELRMN